MRISHGNSLPFCDHPSESLRGKVEWCTRRTLAMRGRRPRRVTLMPAKLSGLRAFFYVRSFTRAPLYMHGMRQKKVGASHNGDAPLTAKAPSSLSSDKANSNAHITVQMDRRLLPSVAVMCSLFSWLCPTPYTTRFLYPRQRTHPTPRNLHRTAFASFTKNAQQCKNMRRQAARS